MENNTHTSYVSLLIITHETALHDLLSLGLSQKGFNVTCTHDKEAALQLIHEKPFDLAICDLMLQGSHDPEFIEALKKAAPETEVIVASGFSTLERSVDSTRNQTFDYIARPFSINHLSGILDRALEKKRLRAEVAHLSDVNRAKMELMWTLGHELRTPMTAIIGFTALHLAGIYGQVSPEQAESLKNVKSSGEAIIQLLNNILDLSKLTVDQMPLNPDVFNLTEFSKDLLGSLESLVHSKRLYLSLDAPSDVWIKTDRARLRQVMINLVGNAIKFTDRGGVTVRLRATDDRNIHIEVSDTGMGMKKEDLPKLFCEFTRLSESSSGGQGAGLGLAITKKTVELMGGQVTVESEWGEGSCFQLCLPVGLTARNDQARAAVFN